VRKKETIEVNIDKGMMDGQKVTTITTATATATPPPPHLNGTIATTATATAPPPLHRDHRHCHYHRRFYLFQYIRAHAPMHLHIATVTGYVLSRQSHQRTRAQTT